MTTTNLYRIAERQGITVDRFPLSENASVSVKDGDKLFVGLDNALCGVNERVCLAHELGHCETYSFYNIHSPFDVRAKHERRADMWAIKKLVPKTVLKKALKSGYDNVYSLAEYFSVTTDFMQKAIDYYMGA